MKKLAFIFALLASVVFADQNKKQEIFLADYGSRNSATLNTALNDVASTDKPTFVLSGGRWTVTADVTFPSNSVLHIVNGSDLYIDTGYTVTLADVTLVAGNYPIFVGAGSATGPASFYYRWPDWGNTTRFAVGTGACISTNDSFVMASGTTIQPDNVQIAGSLDVQGACTAQVFLVEGSMSVDTNLVVSGACTTDVFTATDTTTFESNVTFSVPFTCTETNAPGTNVLSLFVCPTANTNIIWVKAKLAGDTNTYVLPFLEL